MASDVVYPRKMVFHSDRDIQVMMTWLKACLSTCKNRKGTHPKFFESSLEKCECRAGCKLLETILNNEVERRGL